MKIVLVGPTASGKSSLAIHFAKEIGNLVLLNGDAFSVYKDMTIGTAKPTLQELDGVDLRLTDLVDPTVDFSLYDYKCLADKEV